METQVETPVAPAPSTTPTEPLFVWHITRGDPRPGMKALCGATMEGYNGGPVDHVRDVCPKCAAIMKRGR